MLRPCDNSATHTDTIIILARHDHKRLDTASHHARWDSVRRDIHLTGTYDLTETELTFGAKLAWRNSARCIGRIQWAKLQVSLVLIFLCFLSFDYIF